jgi:hypothetical protein
MFLVVRVVVTRVALSAREWITFYVSHFGGTMKGIIAMVTMVCGTALLITQFLHDGFISGGPAYCEYIGVGMCLAGVTMAFLIVGQPATGASRQPAAV